MTDTSASEKKHKKLFSKSKFKRRYCELMISSAVISSVIYLLNLLEVLVTPELWYAAILAGTILFMFYNVKRCIASRSRLKSRKVYFITNFAAYFAFMLTGIIIHLGVTYLGGTINAILKELYTYLFAITKLLRLVNKDISMRYSLLLFHGLGILCIFAGRIKSSKSAPKRKKIPAKRKRHSHHGHHSSHSHHGHHSHHSHHGHHGHHDSNS